MSSSINPALVTQDALQEFITSLHSKEVGTTSMNAKVIVDRFFTDDIELTYANKPTVNGKKVVLDFFETQMGALQAFTHEIPFFDFIAPDKVYQPADVGYLIKGDDPEKDWINVRAIAIFWLREEEGRLKIRKANMALDVSQVTERMRAKGLIP